MDDALPSVEDDGLEPPYRALPVPEDYDPALSIGAPTQLTVAQQQWWRRAVWGQQFNVIPLVVEIHKQCSLPIIASDRELMPGMRRCECPDVTPFIFTEGSSYQVDLFDRHGLLEVVVLASEEADDESVADGRHAD